MRMDMKLDFFILMHTVVLLEANQNLSIDFTIFPKAIIDYLFPKDPNIMRVRYPDEVHTHVNNVTTLDFIGLVKSYGYPAEEHKVTTVDGYNLVIHRIPRSPLPNTQQRRKVVFLQHGLISSSDSWISIGTRRNLAFLLADQGYDVWLGNVRGNSYCRTHIKLAPRDKDFWQFSFHEMGTRDLPVMFDYILNYTTQKKLRYIGYSMGAPILFILLSIKPEYNAKIELGILLGPTAIWKEIPPAIGYVQNVIPLIKEFLDSNEVYEIASLSSTTITLGRTLCADNTVTQAGCAAIIFLIAGSDPVQLNTMALSEILSYYPAGTSVRTVHHYFQNIFTQKFQSYDFGYFDNYKNYGQATPIMYDLKKVTAPLALFYGANDLLTPKSNVLETSRQLPNVILLEENPYKLFTHMDFIWAIDVKALIYDRIIEVLLEHDM